MTAVAAMLVSEI